MDVIIKADKEKLTFGAFARDIWLPSVVASKGEGAMEARILRLHLLPWFADMRVCEISGADIQKWRKNLEKRGFKPASINRFLMALRSAFNYARESGLIKISPVAGIQARKITKRMKPEISQEKFNALLENLWSDADPKSRALLLVAITGASKNEILSSRWDEWRGDNLFCSKSGKNISLNSNARHILDDLAQNKTCDWIFPNKSRSGPLNDIFCHWAALRDKLGLAAVRILDLNSLYRQWRPQTANSPNGNASAQKAGANA